MFWTGLGRWHCVWIPRTYSESEEQQHVPLIPVTGWGRHRIPGVHWTARPYQIGELRFGEKRCLKIYCGTGEIILLVRMLAIKVWDLNSILETHGRKRWDSTSCLWPPCVCCGIKAHACMRMRTHTTSKCKELILKYTSWRITGKHLLWTSGLPGIQEAIVSVPAWGSLESWRSGSEECWGLLCLSCYVIGTKPRKAFTWGIPTIPDSHLF